MIHADDGVEFLFAYGHIEYRVRRKRTIHRRALLARPFYGGTTLADLFVAEQAVLAGMRIEPRDGDARVRLEFADGVAGEPQDGADALFLGTFDGGLER